jgi:hypothetical protein
MDVRASGYRIHDRFLEDDHCVDDGSETFLRARLVIAQGGSDLADHCPQNVVPLRR